SQQTLIDAADCFLQIAPQDPMELNSLPARKAQRPVGVTSCKLVDSKVPQGGQSTARDLAAHHEYELLAGLIFRSVLASVPILLLIGAVELQKILVCFIKVVIISLKGFPNGAPQLATVFLDKFHSRPLNRWLNRGLRTGYILCFERGFHASRPFGI